MPTLSPVADLPQGESSTRVGNVRWTICALLFVATTINYMDRQVLSILKPTLQHSIGLSEQGYGSLTGWAHAWVTASSWLCGAWLRWATPL